MHKAGWVLAGSAVLAGTALVVAGRPKTHKIEALRPYTYREQITYSTMALVPGVAPNAYLRHIYWLHGIDDRQLMKILGDETKKLPGAIVNSYPTKQYFSFHASNSSVANPCQDLVAMSGAAWLPATAPASDRKQIAYTVLEEIPLSKWQVLLYKMSHRNDSTLSM